MFWTVIRMTNVAADLGKDDRGNMWRWMKGKKQWRKCGMRRCNTNTFTDRDFYAKKPLHTKSFTQKHRGFYTQSLCTQTLLHTDTFYTRRLLHTNGSTHSDFYTRTLFTHRSFYTQTLLHTKTLTHRRFYTQTLLHRRFTHRRFYTNKPFTHNYAKQNHITVWSRDTARTHRRFSTRTLLHADRHLQTHAFTHRRCCTRTRLHKDAFTHRHFYTDHSSSVFDDRTSFRA